MTLARKILRTVALLTQALATGPLHAQRAAPDATATLPRVAMDAYFDRLARFGASGAVLVARGGRVLYGKGFGWADRARRVPMSTHTGVDIASMSKDLTAIAILQLEQRGLLRLTDSIGAYFDSLPEDKRTITVQQLLTHRSGLPSYFVKGDDFSPLTRRQAFDAIRATTLEFAPGTDESYSDAGYVLLAILLEHRTGMTLETFLEREQFRPAGLRRTHSYGTPALQRSSDIAHGYLGTRDAGSAATYVVTSDYWVVKGAGGVVSTVEDIATWEAALRSARLVDASRLALLLGTTEPTPRLGLAGPPTRLASGQRGWIRTGAQDFGFGVGAIRYADDSTVVVVAVNRQPEEMDVGQLRTRLLADVDAFVMGTPPVPPPATGAMPVGVAGIDGTYVLDDGSTLRVSRDADNVIVTPDGPLAVELLSYAGDTAGRGQRLALATRATAALAPLCRGDLAPLRALFARPSQRLETYLTSAVCTDSTARVRAIGSIPRWWTRTPSRMPATLLEVASAARTTRMRLEWEGDRISAVGGGGIVAPVVRFGATTDPAAFVGYHLGLGASATLHWVNTAAERDQLVLSTAGGRRSVARRLTGR